MNIIFYILGLAVMLQSLVAFNSGLQRHGKWIYPFRQTSIKNDHSCSESDEDDSRSLDLGLVHVYNINPYKMTYKIPLTRTNYLCKEEESRINPVTVQMSRPSCTCRELKTLCPLCQQHLKDNKITTAVHPLYDRFSGFQETVVDKLPKTNNMDNNEHEKSTESKTKVKNIIEMGANSGAPSQSNSFSKTQDGSEMENPIGVNTFRIKTGNENELRNEEIVFINKSQQNQKIEKQNSAVAKDLFVTNNSDKVKTNLHSSVSQITSSNKQDSSQLAISSSKSSKSEGRQKSKGAESGRISQKGNSGLKKISTSISSASGTEKLSATSSTSGSKTVELHSSLDSLRGQSIGTGNANQNTIMSGASSSMLVSQDQTNSVEDMSGITANMEFEDDMSVGETINLERVVKPSLARTQSKRHTKPLKNYVSLEPIAAENKIAQPKQKRQMNFSRYPVTENSVQLPHLSNSLTNRQNIGTYFGANNKVHMQPISSLRKSASIITDSSEEDLMRFIQRNNIYKPDEDINVKNEMENVESNQSDIITENVNNNRPRSVYLNKIITKRCNENNNNYPSYTIQNVGPLRYDKPRRIVKINRDLSNRVLMPNENVEEKLLPPNGLNNRIECKNFSNGQSNENRDRNCAPRPAFGDLYGYPQLLT